MRPLQTAGFNRCLIPADNVLTIAAPPPAAPEGELVRGKELARRLRFIGTYASVFITPEDQQDIEEAAAALDKKA